MSSHLSAEQLAELSASLLAREAELKRGVSLQLGEVSRVEHARDLLVQMVNEGGAQQDSDRDVDLARTEQMLSDLSAVNAALQRIKRHLFGNCLECGDPIDVPRLQAQPWVAYCLRCQEQRERATGFRSASM